MNRLANLILNKSSEDCSIPELQQLINKYPCFNAGYLLLAKKLQFEDPGQLADSFKKATLYFHPLQFNQTISRIGYGELIISKEPEIIVAKTEEPLPEPAVSETVQVNTGNPAEIKTQEVFSDSEPALSAIEQKNNDDEPQPPAVSNGAFTTEQPVHTDLYTRVLASADLSSEAFAKDETSVDEPETGNVQPLTNISEGVLPDQQPESSISKGPEGLPGRVLADQRPISGDEIPLSFEPYHLVDYFASQGIKIVIEEKPTDRFTRQLKSFTEWLKAMKKLPASENITVPNTAVEQKVEQLAETSLTNTEVVTEAMAEVWEKQGNPEKAIEIYYKLSLLEPSKSPYFASRISDLKKIN
jgi:hypothetical protein